MNKNKPERRSFSVRERLNSFKYSFQGLVYFFREEHNARIHLVMAVAALAFSLWLPLSGVEWMLIILCIVLVIGAEVINTSIEKLCNAVHPQFHPLIRQCKDLASAAVLLMAIASAICGCIIFIPKLIEKISAF